MKYMRPCRVCGGGVEFEHDCSEACDCVDRDIDMLEPIHERCHDGALKYLRLGV